MLKSGVGVSAKNTDASFTDKHGRLLGHLIGTREMSRGHPLRSIHFIWFLKTWVTVENSINASLC